MTKLQVYTDGASRSNPGLAAAGYWITEKEHSVHVFSDPTTNNFAELFAIDMFLNDIKRYKIHGMNFDEYVINSDSQLAIGILSKNWKATKNLDLVNSIKIKLGHLKELGYVITFNKVKGHSDVYGNVMVDRLLNEAMDEVS